jgi:L-ribulose-5-phosphate 4-epimerase
MGFEALQEEVWQANMGLVEAGLVVLTWGNASAADRRAGVMAIKPSGVAYDRLRPQDMVVLSLETGQVVQGDMRPSSDTPVHMLLYRGFGSIGGVVHTHSAYATAWAQARREIPCLGTTHADQFHGPVPLTRQLTEDEVAEGYERNVGRVIVSHFADAGLDPARMPAVLLPGHGPFVWGPDVRAALENAIVLEETARMAFRTVLLNPDAEELPQCLLDRHFFRKHGPGAYYGQQE